MKGAIMQFNADNNPSRSAVYLVNRDKQGKWYRFYNAETQTWGLCKSDLDEAYEAKDTVSPVGFFPWVGPLTGPDFKGKKKVIDEETSLVNVPVAEVMAKPAKVKVAKTKATKTPKATYADGDIVFRDDRKKFVTFIGGKQVAARPTVEAIQKYLKKNHGIEGRVI